MVKTCTSTAEGGRVLSLVGELRSYMPSGAAKKREKKKKKTTKKQSVFFLLKKLSFLLTSCQNRNLPSNEQRREAREIFQKVLLMRLWAPGYYQVRLNINT